MSRAERDVRADAGGVRLTPSMEPGVYCECFDPVDGDPTHIAYPASQAAAMEAVVEAVAVALYETGAACGCTDYELRVLARYALDLAERAAAEGLAAGEQMGDVEAPPNYYRPSEYLGGDAAAEAVRRAVGGA